MASRKKYSGLTVRDCLLRTGIQHRVYESGSKAQYEVLNIPLDSDRGAVVLVRYTRSRREAYLQLERILNNPEVFVPPRNSGCN